MHKPLSSCLSLSRVWHKPHFICYLQAFFGDFKASWNMHLFSVVSDVPMSKMHSRYKNMFCCFYGLFNLKDSKTRPRRVPLSVTNSYRKMVGKYCRLLNCTYGRRLYLTRIWTIYRLNGHYRVLFHAPKCSREPAP